MLSNYRFISPPRRIPIRPGGVEIAAPIAHPDTVYTDPSLAPPANSFGINLDANQAIVGANTRYTPAALQLQIPADCYGVISAISLLLNGIVLASNVIWQIRVNNSPAPGFSALTILGRDGAASVAKSYDGPLRILIPLGGIVSVTILDIDGGSYTAGTTLYGWYWPQQR